MRSGVAVASLVLLAGLPGWAAAQIKLPIFDETKSVVRNVVFEDASRKSDYQHGRLLRITLTKDPKHAITGVLVRTDPSTRTLYVRTEPGTPPRAIPASEIQHIDKGVIKEVAFSKDVAEPEIQPLVIYNGAQRSVSYQAPSLSPGELTTLADLEAAENQLARLESALRAQQQIAENNVAAQAAQQNTRAVANQLLAQDAILLKNYGAYAYMQSPYGRPLLTWPNLAPMPAAGNTAELLAAAMIASPVLNPAPALLPNPSTTLELLAAAQRRVEAARTHVYFENGHVVAAATSESVQTPTNAKP